MANIQKINPEQAAHNIAAIFSNQYIKNLNSTRILSVDSSEISTAARKAAL